MTSQTALIYKPCDGTTACSQIQHSLLAGIKALQRPLNEMLGLSPGNQDVLIDDQPQRPKVAITHEVSKRFTVCSRPACAINACSSSDASPRLRERTANPLHTNNERATPRLRSLDRRALESSLAVILRPSPQGDRLDVRERHNQGSRSPLTTSSSLYKVRLIGGPCAPLGKL